MIKKFLIKTWIKKVKTSEEEKWVIEVKNTKEVVSNIVVNSIIKKIVVMLVILFFITIGEMVMQPRL